MKKRRKQSNHTPSSDPSTWSWSSSPLSLKMWCNQVEKQENIQTRIYKLHQIQRNLITLLQFNSIQAPENAKRLLNACMQFKPFTHLDSTSSSSWSSSKCTLCLVLRSDISYITSTYHNQYASSIPHVRSRNQTSQIHTKFAQILSRQKAQPIKSPHSFPLDGCAGPWCSHNHCRRGRAVLVGCMYILYTLL